MGSENDRLQAKMSFRTTGTSYESPVMSSERDLRMRGFKATMYVSTMKTSYRSSQMHRRSRVVPCGTMPQAVMPVVDVDAVKAGDLGGDAWSHLPRS